MCTIGGAQVAACGKVASLALINDEEEKLAFERNTTVFRSEQSRLRYDRRAYFRVYRMQRRTYDANPTKLWMRVERWRGGRLGGGVVRRNVV